MNPQRDPILHRVAEGDQAAVRLLLDRYGGLVYTLARRFSYDQAEIEDAVQDIFVALWKSAARFNEQMGSEETFVAMVARRRLIDRRRRAQRRIQPVPDADVTLTQGRPEPARPEINEQAQRAMEVLGTLREEQQRVLRLAILQGVSHDQIAKITGMPLGTVKTHVRRGLIALREAVSATPANKANGWPR